MSDNSMNDNSKRKGLAFFLSILVVLVYMNIFIPKPQVDSNNSINVQNQNYQVSDGGNNFQNNNNANVPQDLNQGGVAINNTTPQNVTIPTLDELNQNKKKFITNVAEFEISELGGKIISYKLVNYPKELNSKELVELIDVNENNFYPLALIYNGKRDDLVKYSVSLDGANIKKIDENTFKILGSTAIKLEGVDENNENRKITKVINVNPDSYLFDVSIPSLTENDNAWIEWQHVFDDGTKDRYNEFSILHLVKNSNKVKKVGMREKASPVQDFGENAWLSAGYKYFMATLVMQSSGVNSRLGAQNGDFVLQGKLDSLSKGIKIYLGPRDRNILGRVGFDLQKSFDLGVFSIIAYPLLCVLEFFYKILKNYGLAIILLTLVIKLLFLPLTSASMKSMKKMAELQPKIQELRARIKDPNKLNQEVMNLYKQYNVNPMGGCLPILIQIPVFFGLYNALINSISLRHSSFALWITDLSAPEKLQIFGIGVPVMILLMGASMFIMQLTTPTTVDPAQKKAMLITPIIFTVVFLVSPFPSGLVLYWLTNNLISIVQQKVLKSEGEKISPLKATIIGSAVIFGFGFILTLF